MTRPDMAFAGSDLDRAAALRDDPAVLAQALAAAQVLPVWRGKPLTQAEGASLALLPAGHALLQGAPAILVGRIDGRPLAAADLSAWAPPDSEPLPDGSFLDPTEQRHPDLPADHAFRELRGLLARLDAREGEIAATAKALLGWHATHRFCAACGSATEMRRGGWQRHCPACGATHFPRTDPVAIMLVTRGNRTLLGRSAGWPPGMYSCLAGFVEPGETLEAAVRREVAEETAVTVGRVRYIASQPWPFPASLMLGCHGEAESEAISVDPAELEDALWVSREDMADILAGSHPVIRAPRRGAIARALLARWVADRRD